MDQPLKKVKNKAIEVFRCVRQLRSYHQHKSLFDQGLVEYSFDNFDQLQNQPKIYSNKRVIYEKVNMKYLDQTGETVSLDKFMNKLFIILKNLF